MASGMTATNRAGDEIRCKKTEDTTKTGKKQKAETGSGKRVGHP